MMEQDRELLELAAKAAGREIEEWDACGFAQTKEQERWNPLVDDGDALRLAATLGIDVEWRADGRVAAYRHANANGYCFTALESSRGDRAANVRRAIVRAALSYLADDTRAAMQRASGGEE